jgi:hypothetical protein
MALTRTVSDYKDSVKAATVGANINLSAAPNTLDGVSLAVGDRILVKDQSPNTLNGIYRVTILGTGSNGTWTRTGDFNDWRTITSGALTFVEQGAISGNIFYYIPGGEPNVTVGSTAITFANLYTLIDTTAPLQSVTNYGNTTTNAITISNAAQSGSSTSGALIVTGGVGIGGNLYVSGNLVVTGNITTTNYETISQTEYANSIIASGNVTAGGFKWTNGNVYGGYFTVSEINAANAVANLVSNVTTLRFDSATGFKVYDWGNNTAKIALGSSFATWYVAGQGNLKAVGEDTAQFIAGSGISITTNNSSIPQSITFSSTYSNSNVAAYLPTYTGTLSPSSLTTNSGGQISGYLTGAIGANGGNTGAFTTITAGTIGNSGATLTGTLSTAAQTNITSVGTLTGLTSTGTVAAPTVIAATIGNAGAVIYGTLNSQSASQTNITSVGTLTGLATSGNITAQTSNVYATYVVANSGLSGTLITNAQTNITSVGTLTSLISSGNINTSASLVANNVYANSVYPNTVTAGNTIIDINSVRLQNTILTSVYNTFSSYSTNLSSSGVIVSFPTITLDSSVGYCMEFFIKFSSLSGTITPYFNSITSTQVSIDFSTTGITINSHGYTSNTTNFTLTNGVWYHIALIGTGSTAYWAVNGVVKSTGFGGGFNADVLTNTLDIYKFYGAATYSNFRIVTGSPVYSTLGFAPPGAALTAISGTQLLTLQNSTFVDNSGTSTTISTTGSPTLASDTVGAAITLPTSVGSIVNGIGTFANIIVAGTSRAASFTTSGGGQITGYHTGAIGANTANSGAFTTLTASGNITAQTANVYAANVIGNTAIYGAAFYFANGTPFTTSSYGNTQVAAYLPTYTGTLSPSSLTTNNGGQLTGYLTGAIGANTPNSGVFTTASTSGNLTVGGNLNLTGNVVNITSNIYSQGGIFYGTVPTGFNALYAGQSTFTPLAQTVFQASDNYNGFTQINHQNTNNGSAASTDYVATADNGTQNDGYIDFGINSSTFAQGTLDRSNDGFMYVAGNTTTLGGNLVIGTLAANDIIFGLAGSNPANEFARMRANTNSFVISSTTSSTSTTTGAMQVRGGLGVSGNLYIGGNLSIAGNTTFINTQTITTTDTISAPAINAGTIGNTGTSLVGTLSTAAQTNITSTGALTSPSFTTSGGGQLVGYHTGAIGSNSANSGAFTTVTTTGNLYSGGNIIAASGTTSTSTTTGALVVSGGAGISGALYMGGNLVILGNSYIGPVPTTFNYNAAPLNLTNSLASALKTQLNLINTGGGAGAGSAIDFYTYTSVAGGSNPETRISTTDDGNYSGYIGLWTKTPGNTGANSLVERLRVDSAGNVVVFQTTTSTSTTTGALVVNGGVGIAGAVYANNFNGVSLYASIIGNSGATLTGTLSTAAQTNITSVGTLTGLVSSANITAQTANVYAASIIGNTAIYGAAYYYANGTAFTGGGGGSTSPGGANTMVQFNNGGSFAGATYLQYNITSGNLVSNSTTQSTSTTTGALVLAGGLGIAGNLYVGGNLSIAGNTTFINTQTITTTDTISAPVINANVVGNTGSSHYGTIATNAQPFITSVGTLSALTVSGNTNLQGNTNAVTINAANVYVTTVGNVNTNGNITALSGTLASTVNNSLYFNGSNSSVSGTVAAVNGNFTMEAWVYPTVLSNSTNPGVVSIMNGTGTNTGFWLYVTTTGWFVRNLAGNLILYSATPSANVWYHVALVRNGSTTSLYINGVSVASTASALTLTDTTFIAGDFNTAGGHNYFTGYITGIRYVNGTAVYTANFTPSYAPATSIANTALLLDVTSSAAYLTDGSSAAVTVTATGLPTFSTLSYANTFVTASYIASPFLYANSNTGSTSTTTGTMVITGGAGISGNLYVGNIVTTSGIFYPNGATAGGGGGSSTAAGANTAIQFANGTAFGGATYLQYNYVSGNLVSNSITTSTSTTTGAIVISGGMGVGGNLYVGGNLSIAGNTTFINTQTITTTDTIAAPIINANVVGNVGSSHYGTIATNAQPYITSVGTLSGLTTSGNVTVGSNSWIIANNFSTTAGTNGNIYIDPDGAGDVVLSAATTLYLLDTTATNSTTSGTLISSGGAGIAGNVYVGGNIYTQQRTGYTYSGNSTSVAYTYYNSTTNSLDTVFG